MHLFFSKRHDKRDQKLLLDALPKSVLYRTSNGSDVLDCVEMAGRHHPTKDLILAREAKEQEQVQHIPSDDDGKGTYDDQTEILDFQNDDYETRTHSDNLLIDLVRWCRRQPDAVKF
jgi:hypothetical protein